ncbi:hypothetical protein PILCRDRAFT_821464 [Piloderma croceum F 1598]|uniref:Invertebrate defensins family profile domain-containing protein n=1 Tax=Piloderma croceum (strain F 1598) TaxID=765440 RepID=A0A0C3B560_PILCF|nr:hypothetical protein PILCRDRAFT_821464 [Piloderma croceum F 1598]
MQLAKLVFSVCVLAAVSVCATPAPLALPAAQGVDCGDTCPMICDSTGYRNWSCGSDLVAGTCHCSNPLS